MNEIVKTQAQWKLYLTEAHGNTKEAMLEEAKRLYEYQQSCDSKQGGSVFAETVKEWCGYSRQTAVQMAAVGGSKLLDNNVIKLPESWGTCYELATLTEDQFDEIPLTPSLTRKQVKNFKQFGSIDAPEIIEYEPEADEDATELEEAAVLMPPLEMYGISEFGTRALEKDRMKIQDSLRSISKSATKKFISTLMDVFKYHERILMSEIRRQIPLSIEARSKQLDKREEALVKRERAIEQGLPIKDKKLIQSVLHPDKAPAGQEARYAKAFDAFRKVV